MMRVLVVRHCVQRFLHIQAKPIFLLGFSLLLSQASLATETQTDSVKPKSKQRMMQQEGLRLDDYSAPAKTLEESIQQQKDNQQTIRYDLNAIIKETNATKDEAKNIQRSIAKVRTRLS